MSTARLGDRSMFPDLHWSVYGNHAAVSPLSQPAQAAVVDASDRLAQEGLGALTEDMELRDGLRADLARLLQVEPSTVGLIANTSAGISHIALSIPWKTGDRVLTFQGEFPANITPWMCAANAFDLTVERLSLDGVTSGGFLEDLRAELSRGVRLVAVSAVQFQTGLRMPIEAMGQLCHEHGAELFVDGIQAVGSTPLDLSHVDYLAAGSHKWMMGCMGTGVLYVATQAAQHLIPRTAGWLSHDDDLSFLSAGAGHLRYDHPLRRQASVFEGGAASALVMAALRAGIQPLLALGVDNIWQHIQQWHDAVEPSLIELGYHSERAPTPAFRSGSLALRPPQGTSLIELNAQLADRGIAASTPDGRIRLAPHWPNSIDETHLVTRAFNETSGH